MGEQIRFRARLASDDWDRATGTFRCSALAIPRAKVKAIHSDGAELAPRDYTVDYETHEIRLRDSSDRRDRELSVSIALESKLTSLRTAGASGGVLALATALVAAIAQYVTAVEPAKIAARTAHEQLVVQTQKQKACELALEAQQPPAASPSETNSTRGDGSPIIHGSGTVSIHGR